MGKKLQWLEAMRAIAACWVLLHHADGSIGHFIGPLGNAVVANGYLGVDFFFVLSGFIIAFSSNRLLETRRGFGDYARARLIRVYVPYLPVGIAMLVLYMLLPGVSETDRTPGVLTSLTLLPSASPHALSVAWTLTHELLFYSLFSLIFISRTLLWWVLAVWLVLICYMASTGMPLEPGWSYLLSPLNLCFLLGVAIYYLTRNGVTTSGAIAAGVFGVIVVFLQAGEDEPKRWLLALGFSGFIICALSAWAQRWSPGRGVLFMGAASYSIYLVHNTILSIAIRILNRMVPGVAALPAFLTISAAALIAGLAYYYFYERHGLRLARRLFCHPGGSIDPPRRSVARAGPSIVASSYGGTVVGPPLPNDNRADLERPEAVSSEVTAP